MKATIKADGTLFISAETELESYALKMWNCENDEGEKVASHLVFSIRLDEQHNQNKPEAPQVAHSQ